ncbi:MAG TPA: VOC family protein [Actinospica sp.]|nr:VOC family protein [Actinospica sp.]
MDNVNNVVSSQAASDAVLDIGWRFLLGTLRASVAVGSVAEAVRLAQAAAAACGDDADRHLRMDVRPDRVVLTLQSAEHAAVTGRDVELARAISADINTETHHSVQLLEIGIDALDIPSVRPFWKAVLGYVAEPGADGPRDPLVDPTGQGPAIWFQQMAEPRPQRNRIHFDLCVPHDEALTRIEAALAAGGRLVSDRRAPAFWVLADAEGNEICVTTWQGRSG